MVFRIFLALVVLANLFLVFQIAQTARAKSALGRAPSEFVIGAPDASVTVVEFVDYSCQACHLVDPHLRQAIEKSGNIRYIVRPINSDIPWSGRAASLVYAAAQQGKFAETHALLMQEYRELDDAFLAEIVQTVGLDAAKLEADMKTRDAKRYISRNEKLLKRMQSRYVPYVVINNKIGFVPNIKTTSDDFLKLFQQAGGRT